jgi:hypothetical protein
MALKNRRMFELRLGKAGLTLFIIGMSFLLFSGFLIGVVVGKHMDAYPEPYAFGMMGLIRDRLIAASPKAVKKDAGDVDEETFNLTFYDTLGGKKEGTAPGSRSSDTKNKAPDVPAGQVAAPAKTPRKEAPVESPEETAPAYGRAGWRCRSEESVAFASTGSPASQDGASCRQRPV